MRNGITELLQRAPPIFGSVAIALGIGPHSSFFYMWRKYDVTATYMTLISCDSVCCLYGEAWSSRCWPMANVLTCLCSCQWWTFWTYLVTLNLFSLYLMNFMFHTTLDAVGNILKVHYISMKCHVSFPQGGISTLFRWGKHVCYVCQNVLPAYSSAKFIIIKGVFFRPMITCTATFFMNHSVDSDIWPIEQWQFRWPWVMLKVMHLLQAM